MKTPYRSLLTIGLLATSVSAAASDLANAPMYLGSQVPPNIMIIADDSGSMNWEDIITVGAQSLWGSPADWHENTIRYNRVGGFNQIDPFFQINNKNSMSRRADLRLRCIGINGLYFDPTKTYKPWSGVDINGDPFQNQSITSARRNPYLSDNNNTIDLTSEERNSRGELKWAAGYFIWEDEDGDGEYDANECLDGFVNGSHVTVSRKEVLSKFIPVSSMTVQEQQNFANWYSYYRKREYTSKAVLSEVIEDSTARVGLYTLHNNGEANRAIKDINDQTQPVNLTAQQNKKELLKGLFNSSPDGGTPLRQRLYDVGELYAGPDSPILPIDQGGQCQQNFSLLMTDGLWNGWARYNNGQLLGDSPPSEVRDKIGNQDTGTNRNPWAAGDRYRDKENGVGNTLADIAMYYYGTDFKPNYKDLVNEPDSGKNPAQHMITYTVSFGALGTVSGVEEANQNDFDGWPTPVHDQPTTIDDLMHAAVNGRGKFYAASDAAKLSASLKEAFSNMLNTSSSFSGVAATGTSLQTDTLLFSALFETEHWSGSLRAFEFNANEDIVLKGYASILPAWNKRTIFTSSDVGTDRNGTLFSWENISADQKSLLDNDPSLLNYIRGDQSKEATGEFRKRPLLQITPELKAGSPLGSLINSSPAYVANPNLYYIDSPSTTPKYAEFLKDPDGDGQVYSTTTTGQKLLREPMIYVGSNGGMLHAFNADSESPDFGKERFAFVPSAVYARLPKLAETNFQHVYTVDGSPVVTDVVINEKWQTVLVAGLNAGGQGIYALNINDPKKFTNSKAMAEEVVMWEFTDANDADMGYSFSQPVIAKMNNDQWVAIFGNGYNNTESDGVVGSGHAVLYVVDIATGAVVKKFDTGVNALPNKSNGMSSPTTVDADRDGTVDYIYAGDLEGNLWKFDVRDENADNWDIAYSSQEVGNSASNAYKPLFTACSAECTLSNRQPIMVKPQVQFNKSASGHLVLFGTGSYVAIQDRADKKQQSFYAIWDRHFNNNSQQVIHRKQLLQQTTEAIVVNSSTQETLRVTSQYAINWHDASQGYPISTTTGSNTHLGWFIDLNRPTADASKVLLEGERVVLSSILRDGYVVFYTLIPGSSDPCASGGRSAIFALNLFSGAAPYVPVLDANNDGSFNSNDNVTYVDGNASSVTRPPSAKEFGTIMVGGTLIDGAGSTKLISTDPDPNDESLNLNRTVGRWSWKEIN